MNRAILGALRRTNRRLGTRLGRSTWLYRGVVVLGAVVLVSLTTLVVYLASLNGGLTAPLFAELMFMILLTDLLCSLLRFGRRILLEPFHLVVYPLSARTRIGFHLSLLLSDPKAVFYVLPGLVVFIYFVLAGKPVAALGSLVVFALLAVILAELVTALQLLVGNLPEPKRRQVLSFGTFLFIPLMLVRVTENTQVYLSVPILQDAGYGIAALALGHAGDAVLAAAILALYAILGLMIDLRLASLGRI